MRSKHLAPWPYPALIAHRGAGRFAPENTLAAMRIGKEMGYRCVEYDVKLTRDGKLILMHDDTLDRCSNGTGAAAEKTWREIFELDAGSWHSPAFSGEPIPLFEDVARATQADGQMSNVEIKPCPGREAETGAAVAQAASEWWWAAELAPLLSSFSEEALAAARATAPGLPRALLLCELPPDWLDRLARYDCVSLNIHHTHVTRALIDAAHAAGYRIAAYTVNDPARAQELLGWGLDGLFTDELAAMAAVANH